MKKLAINQPIFVIKWDRINKFNNPTIETRVLKCGNKYFYVECMSRVEIPLDIMYVGSTSDTQYWFFTSKEEIDLFFEKMELNDNIKDFFTRHLNISKELTIEEMRTISQIINNHKIK